MSGGQLRALADLADAGHDPLGLLFGLLAGAAGVPNVPGLDPQARALAADDPRALDAWRAGWQVGRRS
jgi:hypothetical protein